jgi:hypothetical protein
MERKTSFVTGLEALSIANTCVTPEYLLILSSSSLAKSLASLVYFVLMTTEISKEQGGTSRGKRIGIVRITHRGSESDNQRIVCPLYFCFACRRHKM